jgi:peptide-methionine (S)-S-oxide reductase
MTRWCSDETGAGVVRDAQRRGFCDAAGPALEGRLRVQRRAPANTADPVMRNPSMTDRIPTIRLSLLAAVLVVATTAACSLDQGDAGATGTTPAASAEEPSTPPPESGPDSPAATMSPDEHETSESPAAAGDDVSLATATFGAGCYWCVEAVLEQLDGIEDVVSGFMGGHVENPTYEQVCYTDTGHAEVVQVTYDPTKIRYENLLYWFFKLHDPTQLNRQGADVGTQYRSVIFWHDEEQRRAAEAVKEKLTEEKVYDAPIVTEITEAGPFYEAKAEHQDFYRNNTNYGYCRAVIAPKLDKLGLQK